MVSNDFNKQDGYVLLTVLIMFTIVSILGLSLMSYTIGSYQFTDVNKGFIETKSKAEMKAQEAETRIMGGVEEINKNLEQGTLDLKDVIVRINTVLNQTQSKLGSDSTLKRQVLKDGSNGVFLQRVDIEVDVADSDRTLVKTFTISTIADVFRYSAVTPGNLNLNGASYLEGDVYIGSDLSVSDDAYFISYGDRWASTSYPSINGDLSVEKKYYHYDKWRRVDSFSPTDNNLSQFFDVKPRIVTQNPSIDKIDVKKMIDDKKKSDIRFGRDFHTYYGNSYIHTSHGSINRGDTEFRRDLTIYHNGSLKVDGDLLISDDLTVYGSLEVAGSVYVEGDAYLSGTISVGDDEFVYIDGQYGSVTMEDLSFNGSMYINEDIEINEDLNTNGTIYTSKGGNIRNLSNNSGGTLVVLSEQTLTIANNNLYNDEPKEINAFFYSNSNLDIYGVGSNLKINGGIYGKNITLNAIKGKSEQRYFNDSRNYSSIYDPIYIQWPQDHIHAKKSRLSVIYKEDLILNPPEGIPTVEKISVKELDSHFYE